VAGRQVRLQQRRVSAGVLPAQTVPSGLSAQKTAPDDPTRRWQVAVRPAATTQRAFAAQSASVQQPAGMKSPWARCFGSLLAATFFREMAPLASR
jgi:hypothetical protein